MANSIAKNNYNVFKLFIQQKINLSNKNSLTNNARLFYYNLLLINKLRIMAPPIGRVSQLSGGVCKILLY